MIRLRHGKVELALHRLRPARREGAPGLLLLHGLAEASPGAVPGAGEAWPGAVYALDFTGHGRSDVPRGGGYTAEILMGDADAALSHLGSATVMGRGLGAYVALLLAGARPDGVRGAVLCDGPGLAGGGAHPVAPQVPWVDPAAPAPPDPFALVELSRDLRPPDYATGFVRQITHLSPLDQPLHVCARQRTDWLDAVAAEPGVVRSTPAEALSRYAAETG